ncbi:MAG: SufD family Fe-S cluster assembly protein [Alkaliphilus sp.]
MARETSLLLDDVNEKEIAQVGVLLHGEKRTATFIQRDLIEPYVSRESKGFELISIAKALEIYSWVREKFFFKAVERGGADDLAAEQIKGYFLWVKKGIKLKEPIQTCFYLTHDEATQRVHNIIIMEEDSEAHVITGCTVKNTIKSAVHKGISEHYVGVNAQLTSTMLHNWGKEVNVYPRSATIVDDYGKYTSNYICLNPASEVLSSPVTKLEGVHSSAKYLTVVLGAKNSVIDIAGDIHLNGKYSTAELTHRAVCTGGKVYQKGMVYGNAYECKAHVDCAGMIIDGNKDGFILAIPGLKSIDPNSRMSHEASIGKINPEQVIYLQSKGMEELEAISLIVRGFLDIKIDGLGIELDKSIAEISELAGHGED